MTDADWEKLLEMVNEYQELFPDGLAFIGGIAVFAYARSREETARYAAYSHDADFVISLTDYIDLRDLVALTPNKRLNKHQFIQAGFEFDVYVEGQSELRVPVDELMAASEQRSGLRVASIEHLLVLKAVALKDRKGSSKGDKDEDDIVRILIVSDTAMRPEWLSRLDDDLLSEIAKAVEGDACLRLVSGNKHFARIIRAKATDKLSEVRAAYALGGYDPTNLSDGCTP